MSRDAKKRAEAVGDLPHVQAWIKELQELAEKMPREIEVYVASGTPYILALSPKGKSYTDASGTGSDRDAIVDYLRFGYGRWDGGDW